MNRALCFFGLLMLMALPSSGQESDKHITALRIVSNPPVLDGVLDDDVWRRTQFTSGFKQRDPEIGEPARSRSEIAVAYDDDALYVAARLHCVDPERILSTVSRRDNSGNSERIIISLDTYHDGRTAYTFAVTASGTRIDYYHSSDNEYDRDYNFNPVWEVKVARNGEGWSAEMRIPFAQMRFANSDSQIWGVNINRWVPTIREDSYWIVNPREETGWSSRMGEIVGIKGIAPSRRIEVMPYVAGDANFSSESDANNPFNDDGREANQRVGADLKMGVGPNLTLEGTINPDFGQVEADPAEVNLSAFETAFSERRPFFTEGSQLLQGGGTSYFYSRRIGTRPHGSPTGDYVDSPRNSTILGAVKLTGRLNSGLKVGVLSAITQNEKADVYVDSTGATRSVNVEPQTSFGVVRLQQELGSSSSTVGMTLTGMNRDLSVGDGLADILRKRAYSGGVDVDLDIGDREYSLKGSVGFSRVEGTESAIEITQRSSARYYQRPDADHVDLDTTRTSLSGWWGGLELTRNEGLWLWSASGAFESPGFELNDVGILGAADDIDWEGSLTYRQTTPTSIFHNYQAGVEVAAGTNFDGDRQYSHIAVEASTIFRNYYEAGADYYFSPGAQSDNLTRGGPSMGTGDEWGTSAYFGTNYNSRVQLRLSEHISSNEFGGFNRGVHPGVTYRSGGRWELSFDPSYHHIVDARQFVGTEAHGDASTFGTRYVFAEIERSTLVATMRVNYSLTPDFSVEAYMEPFAASGRYSGHGELAAARSKELRKYGTDGTTITREADGSYTVTDGLDPVFTINNLDFNVVSFRSNLVLRWEYKPGSTLFLVWQQDRFGYEPNGSLVYPSNLWDAATASGDNLFAIKFTYWLPIL